MYARIAVCALFVFVAGCCTLEPNSVTVDSEHTSHIGQHFGANPTNFGYNVAEVTATWRDKKGNFVSLSEGYTFGGCLDGMHEVFTARVGHTFDLKP